MEVRLQPFAARGYSRIGLRPHALQLILTLMNAPIWASISSGTQGIKPPPPENNPQGLLSELYGILDILFWYKQNNMKLAFFGSTLLLL